MRPIPVLRHVPHETLGTIEQSLAGAGLMFQYVDLYREVPKRLDLDRAPGLIVLGGPMNVDEVEEYPFLRAETDWIRGAIDAGLPVLGLCLGAQLIAKALGARVFPNGTKEIGWYPIQWTPEADDDRLFSGCATDGPDLIFPGKVFQWHGDTFDLPVGAVQLARSALCENQAFRVGRQVYALQFHIEVTAEMIDQWLDEPANRRELDGLDYIDPSAIRRQTPTELPAMRALGDEVFGRFAAICCAKR